ncbi:MAG: hypothetical protein H6737_29645 [Alphaproteobacteria bacterium]|nr:hypothetical protein [Alphaproteobacteria bacterium]
MARRWHDEHHTDGQAETWCLVPGGFTEARDRAAEHFLYALLAFVGVTGLGGITAALDVGLPLWVPLVPPALAFVGVLVLAVRSIRSSVPELVRVRADRTGLVIDRVPPTGTPHTRPRASDAVCWRWDQLSVTRTARTIQVETPDGPLALPPVANAERLRELTATVVGLVERQRGSDQERADAERAQGRIEALIRQDR